VIYFLLLCVGCMYVNSSIHLELNAQDAEYKFVLVSISDNIYRRSPVFLVYVVVVDLFVYLYVEIYQVIMTLLRVCQKAVDADKSLLLSLKLINV